jgi:hypothetical protein
MSSHIHSITAHCFVNHALLSTLNPVYTSFQTYVKVVQLSNQSQTEGLGPRVTNESRGRAVRIGSHTTANLTTTTTTTSTTSTTTIPGIPRGLLRGRERAGSEVEALHIHTQNHNPHATVLSWSLALPARRRKERPNPPSPPDPNSVEPPTL